MAFTPALITSLNKNAFDKGGAILESSFANRGILPAGISGNDAAAKKRMEVMQETYRRNNDITDSRAEENHRKQIHESIKNIPKLTNPSALRRVRQVHEFWNFVLHDEGVIHANREDNFKKEIVVRHHMLFLPKTITLIKPRYAGTQPSARNFMSIFQVFVMQLVACTHTRDNNGNIQLVGYTILKDGVYQRLLEQATVLIFQHKLNRQYQVKLFYGRKELQLVISELLQSSKDSPARRVVCVQTICQILLVFYATLRPSSMGALDAVHRDAGIYPRLGDVKIMRNGDMDYVVSINIEHHKGSLTSALAEGSKKVILDSVLKGHNVLFDPTLAFLAHLFLRGALAKNYPSLEELFQDKSAEISICSDKLQEPLFLASKAKGDGFIDNATAASSAQASSSFANAGFNAGLPGGSLYCVRRDTGDAYEKSAGLKMAQGMMNHEEGRSVFSTHYSRGVGATMSLTGIRLGEVAGPKEKEPGQWYRDQKKRELFGSVAVEALTRLDLREIDLNKSRSSLDKTVLQSTAVMAIRSLPVVSIEGDMFVKWMAAIGEFEGRLIPKVLCTFSVNKLLGAIECPEPSKLALKNQEQAEEVQKILRSLADDAKRRGTLYKELERTHKRKGRSSMRQTFLSKDSALTGTTEQRREVLERLERDVPVLRSEQSCSTPEASVAVVDEVIVEDGQTAARENRVLRFEGDIEAYFTNATIIRDQSLQEELDEAQNEAAYTQYVNMTASRIGEKHAVLGAPERPDPALDGADADAREMVEHLKSVEDHEAYDEQKEADVFGDMPVEDFKREMMKVYCQPCLVANIRQDILSKGDPICPICSSKEHGHVNLSLHLWCSHRHHSPWGSIKKSIERDGVAGQYMCPSCEDSATFSSTRLVESHMTSTDCKNYAEHRTLREAYTRDHPVQRQKQANEQISQKPSETLPDRMDPLEVEESLRSNMMALSVLSAYQQNPEVLVGLLGPPTLDADQMLSFDLDEDLRCLIPRVPKRPLTMKTAPMTPAVLQQLDYSQRIEYPDEWQIEYEEFCNDVDLDVANKKFYYSISKADSSASLRTDTIAFREAIDAVKAMHTKGMEALKARHTGGTS